MEKFIELFAKWEESNNWPKFAELTMCSDGSGKLIVGYEHALCTFDSISEIEKYFINNAK